MKITAIFVALLALLDASGARAVCVSTTNELAVALQQAESTPLDIQVVKGSYRLDLTPWGIVNDNATLRAGTTVIGGYDAGCTSRDPAPAGTVFTDTGAAHSYSASPDGDFTLESITFDLAGHLYVLGGSVTTADATVTLRHLDVTASHLGSTDAALAVFWYGFGGTNGSARIVDSLFHGSTSTACALAAEAEDGPVTYTIVNVTASDNGIGICLYDETSLQAARFKVYNTISYGNALFGLQSDTQTIALVDDTIGSQNVPGPLSPAPIGLSTANPQLNAGYAPIAPGSPAIDSGTQLVPGGLPATDIDGNPRVVGGGVDRGAYESSYDDSTVQTVTNTNDSGAGSLRTAIHNANLTAGKNTIRFAIGSDCSPVKVIQIASNLEAIAGDTTISGFSQPGASRNTLDPGNDATVCIVLEPASSSTATDGLRVASGAGAGVTLTVDGLGIGGFAQDGVSLLGGSAHNVNGNHFGGSVGGHALAANGVDVRIGADVHDVVVGGDGASQRNIIGGATNGGVYVTGGASPAHDNQIIGNDIGLGWSGGYTNRGNGSNGVYLASADNTVSGNIIGFNGNDGIDVDGDAASGNTITGNTIGGDAGVAFGNGLAGVRVENAGHDNTINSNTIADNTTAGVRIVSGQRNRIRKNSIFANGGLGIDLAGSGVTANDDDTGAMVVDYANRGQNFPLLTKAEGGAFSGSVTGSLTTKPGDYTIDLYVQSGCDASGNGQGRQWLRSGTVTVPVPGIGTQGTVNFSLVVALGVPQAFTGTTITGTATDADGNTSEFSACSAYTDYTIFTDGFDYGSI